MVDLARLPYKASLNTVYHLILGFHWYFCLNTFKLHVIKSILFFSVERAFLATKMQFFVYFAENRVHIVFTVQRSMNLQQKLPGIYFYVSNVSPPMVWASIQASLYFYTELASLACCLWHYVTSVVAICTSAQRIDCLEITILLIHSTKMNVFWIVSWRFCGHEKFFFSKPLSSKVTFHPLCAFVWSS